MFNSINTLRKLEIEETVETVCLPPEVEERIEQIVEEKIQEKDELKEATTLVEEASVIVDHISDDIQTLEFMSKNIKYFGGIDKQSWELLNKNGNLTKLFSHYSAASLESFSDTDQLLTSLEEAKEGLWEKFKAFVISIFTAIGNFIKKISEFFNNKEKQLKSIYNKANTSKLESVKVSDAISQKSFNSTYYAFETRCKSAVSWFNEVGKGILNVATSSTKLEEVEYPVRESSTEINKHVLAESYKQLSNVFEMHKSLTQAYSRNINKTTLGKGVSVLNIDVKQYDSMKQIQSKLKEAQALFVEAYSKLITQGLLVDFQKYCQAFITQDSSTEGLKDLFSKKN